MGLIKSFFAISVFITHGIVTFGATAAPISEVVGVFKAGRYERAASLKSLSRADLKFAGKAENVQGLLELAAQENRISPDAIEMLQLSKLYTSEERGDQLLLVCLNTDRCQPSEFIRTIRISELHREIALRRPGLNTVPHAVGEICEKMMIKFITNSGWIPIQGQIGRQGIDGLFVKKADNLVKDVLVAESKCNAATLQSTQHGMQMSDQWIKRKISQLRAQFPENETYADIQRFTDKGSYRAILWNMEVRNKELIIGLKKIKSKDGSVDFSPLERDQADELSIPFDAPIKLAAPANNFQKFLVSAYHSEIEKHGPKLLEE